MLTMAYFIRKHESTTKGTKRRATIILYQFMYWRSFLFIFEIVRRAQLIETYCCNSFFVLFLMQIPVKEIKTRCSGGQSNDKLKLLRSIRCPLLIVITLYEKEINTMYF